MDDLREQIFMESIEKFSGSKSLKRAEKKTGCINISIINAGYK